MEEAKSFFPTYTVFTLVKPYFCVEYGKVFVGHVPNAKQLVYPGANHGLVWQNGAEIAYEIAEFMGFQNNEKSGR